MSRVVNMIVLRGNENVGVALRDIARGENASDALDREIVAREDIPQAHKIALLSIAASERIIRMDVSVDIASPAIAAGALAHIHNIKSQDLCAGRSAPACRSEQIRGDRRSIVEKVPRCSRPKAPATTVEETHEETLHDTAWHRRHSWLGRRPQRSGASR
jgi:hypothetical protein